MGDKDIPRSGFLIVAGIFIGVIIGWLASPLLNRLF